MDRALDELSEHERVALALLTDGVSTEQGVCALIIAYAALRFDGTLRGHVVEVECRATVAGLCGGLLVCPRAIARQDLSLWTLSEDDGDPTHSTAQRQVVARVFASQSIYAYPGGAFLCGSFCVTHMQFDGFLPARERETFDSRLIAAELASSLRLIALCRSTSGALVLRLFVRHLNTDKLDDEPLGPRDGIGEASERVTGCIAADFVNGVALVHVTDMGSNVTHGRWGKWPRHSLKQVPLYDCSASSSWLALDMPRGRSIVNVAVGDADHIFVSDDLLGIALFDRRDGSRLRTLVEGFGEQRPLLQSSAVLFTRDLDDSERVRAIRRHESVVELFY